MRNKKPLARSASFMLEMAGHTAMGIALGLGFSFALALMDTSTLAVLIAHSSDPKTHDHHPRRFLHARLWRRSHLDRLRLHDDGRPLSGLNRTPHRTD